MAFTTALEKSLFGLAPGQSITLYPEHHDAHVRVFDHHLWHLINDPDYQDHHCKEDIFLWADGTWCLREDAASMRHMSDDFEVILFATDRWHNLYYS